MTRTGDKKHPLHHPHETEENVPFVLARMSPLDSRSCVLLVTSEVLPPADRLAIHCKI
jgi:hypothetical protein